MCACIIAPRRQPRNLFVHGSFWNHKPFAIGSCILAGARMAASTLDSVHNGQPAHECRLNFQVWYQNLRGMLLACWHPGCKRKPVHQNVGQCVLRMLQVLITDRHVCSQTRVLCLLVPVTHPLLFFLSPLPCPLTVPSPSSTCACAGDKWRGSYTLAPAFGVTAWFLAPANP